MSKNEGAVSDLVFPTPEQENVSLKKNIKKLERQLEEEREYQTYLMKRHQSWIEALNEDFKRDRESVDRRLVRKTLRKEYYKNSWMKLNTENQNLKQQIADLQKKIESTPKEEQQAQHEDFKRMLAEAEEESRKAKEECKKMTEERDIFKLAYRQHAKMTEKIQEKLYFFIPKTDLHEEMDEMWHQAVEETKE